MDEIKIKELNLLTPLSITWTDGLTQILFVDVPQKQVYNVDGIKIDSKSTTNYIMSYFSQEKFDLKQPSKQIEAARNKVQQIFSKGFNVGKQT